MANRDYGKKSAPSKGHAHGMADGGAVGPVLPETDEPPEATSRMPVTDSASVDPPGTKVGRRSLAAPSFEAPSGGFAGGLAAGFKNAHAMKSLMDSRPKAAKKMANGGKVGRKK